SEALYFNDPEGNGIEVYRDRPSSSWEWQNGKVKMDTLEVDSQVYQLISDELNDGVAPGVPWKNGPVPVDKAIYGLGPIEIKV
ncbi:hypothetical protein P7996_15695, partial [Staphylococcus aureus]|nr:hypothetical protein [Staphylococcus aureus]